MDWVKIVLLSVTLACLGTSANAQYKLGGAGIFLGTTLVVPRTLQDSRSTLCYNGESLFLGYGFNATTTVIERINASDPTAASTEIDRLPNRNSGLDCCCQYLAYGWAEGMTITVNVVHLGQTNIKRRFTIAHSSAVSFPALILDCSLQLLRIVTREIVYTLDIRASNPTPTLITYSDTLRTPRCVAYYDNAGTPFLISSGPDADSVEIVNLSSFAKFAITIRIDGQEAQIDCLDIDGTTIYILCRVDFNGNDYVLSATASVFVTQTPGAILTVGGGVLTQINSQTVTSTSSFVNGISMCAGCSTLACLTSACTVCQMDAVYPQCGFCSPDDGTCICSNPEPLLGCIYDDPTLAASCTRCVDAADVCLLIYNPVFQRRASGITGEVSVAGVSAASSTTTVARYVTVGRNSPAAWPMPKDATALTPTTTPWKVGFRAPTSATLKGSRAGVFAATFHLDGGSIVERIPGVVVENSGFTQQFVTYTVSQGQSVELQVLATTPNVERAVGTFRWRFTPVSESTGVSGTIMDNLACANAADRRRCSMSGVTKAGNEGVYEAYRPNRRLRNWHPAIFLFVRRCADGKAGLNCTVNCTSCVNGICDAECGSCVCDPGWMGATCNTPCSSGDLFGKGCTLSCAATFPTKNPVNCAGVLLCHARDAGCSCRSGLMPPSCTAACSAGFWGRSCLKACPSCAANNGCNARTGLCNP